MKIEEAIKIKKKYQYVLPKESYPELIVADNLSIEAMKWRKEAEEKRWLGYLEPLPGETKPDTKIPRNVVGYV